MLFKFILSVSFFISSVSFAHEGIPEFFYQVDEAQTAVQGEIGYRINNEERPGSDTEINGLQVRTWLQHGITDNFAVQIGLPYSFSVDTEFNGNPGLDGDSGFNDLEMNLLVHRQIKDSLLLYYGIEGSITLDKADPAGNNPNFFSDGHTFNPYIGLSTGEHCKYGAKLTYKSISTNSDANGGTGGNFDYDLEFFGEINNEESYLLGGALGYQQTSGADDAIDLQFYGRVYLEKFTLIPRISYTHQLDSDIDSQLNLNASLGVRKEF